MPKTSAKKSGDKIDFVTRVGDKLGALRPERSKSGQKDDSLESVWLPGHLFEKFGGEVFGHEVFELDTDESEELKAKYSLRERRNDANPKNEAEDDRQVELAKALRWATNVTSE